MTDDNVIRLADLAGMSHREIDEARKAGRIDLAALGVERKAERDARRARGRAIGAHIRAGEKPADAVAAEDNPTPAAAA
jgi:hypothetical protein